MELTALVLACALLILTGFALFFWYRTAKTLKLSTAARSLPVVDNPTCESCCYFSLEGGQTLMRAQPAFFAAAQVLAPWQMGRPREVKPNPDYDALEAELYEASAAGQIERAEALHERLMTMRPGELLPPETYIEEPILKLQWQDFGACGRHSELRAKSDTCAEWATRRKLLEGSTYTTDDSRACS